MLVTGTIYSKTLELDTGITIIAPNDFTPEGAYKIAYVLHGISGNAQSWATYSLLPAYAVHGHTIYVLPEAGRSFYANQTYGFNYFKYITEELPTACRSLFNISAKREDTIVLGNSMGGFGAILCALSKPGTYGKCAAFSSPCLYLQEEMKQYNQFGNETTFKQQFGERLFQDFRCLFGEQFNCPPEMDLQRLATERKTSPEKIELYCTCGSHDPFLTTNRRFAETMKKTGYDLTYEEWEGEHNFEFFNESLKKTIAKFEL